MLIVSAFYKLISINLSRIISRGSTGVGIQKNEHCSVEDARATMAIYRLVRDDWEADLVKKADLSKMKKSKRQRKQQGLSGRNVGDDSTSSLEPDNLKQPVADATQSAPISTVSENLAFVPDFKRQCQSLPCPSFSHLNKSSSSISLFDDNFWPDDELDTQIEWFSCFILFCMLASALMHIYLA
ncbi:Interferon stimulated 20 kDa exonuclease 2 [Fasciolopsis buskii]|uniref:Interferon stimulated 20 kDa exonuclease 2 n=1 Tax=Fasciolopsis buskii TaxID=27845 RepID=A0A8E0VLM9_9TREM|nr:Interferon stimulated 20 kDa exonuclease 2 [Fasciolopsis buski]